MKKNHINIPHTRILDALLRTPKKIILIEKTVKLPHKALETGSLWLCSPADDYCDGELAFISIGLKYWLGYIKIIKRGAGIILSLPGYKRKSFITEDDNVNVWRIEKFWDLNEPSMVSEEAHKPKLKDNFKNTNSTVLE